MLSQGGAIDPRLQKLVEQFGEEAVVAAGRQAKQNKQVRQGGATGPGPSGVPSHLDALGPPPGPGSVFEDRGDIYKGYQGQVDDVYEETGQPYQEGGLDKLLKYGGMAAVLAALAGVGGKGARRGLATAGASALSTRMGAPGRHYDRQMEDRTQGLDHATKTRDAALGTNFADSSGYFDEYGVWKDEAANARHKDNLGYKRDSLQNSRTESGPQPKEPLTFTSGELENKGRAHRDRRKDKAHAQLGGLMSERYSDAFGPEVTPTTDMIRREWDAGNLSQESVDLDKEISELTPEERQDWESKGYVLKPAWGDDDAVLRDPEIGAWLDSAQVVDMPVGEYINTPDFRKDTEAVYDVANEDRGRNYAADPQKIQYSEPPPPKPPDMEDWMYEQLKKDWANGWRPQQ